jgi:uncharacterized protein
MAFVWDEQKRRANLRKHGLDFADAHYVYDNPDKLTFLSRRIDEARKVDFAEVARAGRVLALIYTERGDDIRVISFRVASRLEREIYAEREEQDELGSSARES